MAQRAKTDYNLCVPRGVSVPESDSARERNKALMSRLVHLAIALGLAAALLFSFWLTPDPRGVGTHEQLMLLPCNFYSLTKLPCPFCGMTTAFTHMARGQVREALLAQPVGALGFLLCVIFLPISFGAAVFGKDAVATAMRLPWQKLSRIIVAMLAGAWILKIVLTLIH